MEVGAVIIYAAVFLAGLFLGRVWGGAAARRQGNMLSAQRGNILSRQPAPATPPDAATHAPPDAAFEEEVRRLVAAGNIINAIKLYRERVGCGLAEAKDAVERIRG